MKNSILIILLIGINIVSSQELKKEKMIQQFIVDLFNDNITPFEVIEKFMEIKNDKNNTLSIEERKLGAVKIIQETRNGKGVDGNWLIPNYSIKNIKKPKVYPYREYENLNQFEISDINTIKENIYVLLDSEKEKIVLYVLLNENNDKIISFSLLVKPENQAWFFTF